MSTIYTVTVIFRNKVVIEVAQNHLKVILDRQLIKPWSYARNYKIS